MTPERFRQVRNLFEAALEREPHERTKFVAEAVTSDTDLKNMVMSMLDAHERRVSFIDGGLTAPPDLSTDPRRLEGRRLGAYEVLKEIGHGGMGTVFLGRRADGVFEQRVAIKVMTPATANPEIARRFLQERAILASLDHPNIARIYDGGSTEEGWPYFVMEYVDGTSIVEWCDERRLNTSERLRLFRDVCTGVHYAHLRGVIHRDLKPPNILVTTEATVKLLDFGIAKVLQTESQQMETRTLVSAMTPEFASPEQFRGEATTPATDVYALGVVLYLLLTGRRPYRLRSRTFTELMHAICEETSPRASRMVTETYEEPLSNSERKTISAGILSATREGTPIDLKRRLAGDLDNILSMALEKAPTDRYRSAEQLSADIGRHLEGRPILASRPGAIRRLFVHVARQKVPLTIGVGFAAGVASGAIRVEWSAALYLGGALLLAGIWMAATNQALGAAIHNRFYSVRIPVLVGLAVAANIALYVWSQSRQQNLFLWRASFLAPVLWYIGAAISWSLRLQWAGALLLSRHFRISTVGLWLMFLLRVPTSLSPTERLTAVIAAALTLATIVFVHLVAPFFEVRERGILYRGRFYSWLDMAEYSWAGVWDGNPPKNFRALPYGTECLRISLSRRWLLSDRELRIPIVPEDVSLLDRILRQNLSPVALLPADDQARPATYLIKLNLEPPRRDFADHYEADAPLRTHRRTSMWRGVIAALLLTGIAGTTLLYISPLFEHTRQRHKKIAGPQTGTPERRFTGYMAYVLSVAFSPDGRELASGGVDCTVRLWNADSGRMKYTLARHTGVVHAVAFSPDGQRLASASQDTTVALWDINTGELIHRLLGHASAVHSVRFSPDGRYIASGSYDGNIFIWNASTYEQVRILNGGVGSQTLVFTPSGDELAAPDVQGIRVWNVATGHTRLSLTDVNVHSIAFSPDGHLLAGGGTDKTVRLWDVVTGANVRTFALNSFLVHSVAFSSNGFYLAAAGDVIGLWDLRSGIEIRQPSHSRSAAQSIAFHPGGKLVASGSLSSRSDVAPIRIWEVATGRTVHRMTGHASTVTCVTVDESQDNTVVQR